MSRTRTEEEELASLATELNHDLSLIQQRIQKPLQAEFAKGKLTAPQRLVMQALVHSDGLSLKQLSAQVGLAHSTVSVIVDRLQARGMVSRRRPQSDHRVRVITASPEVREFLRKRVPEIMIAPLVKALRRGGEIECGRVMGGVRRLRELLEGKT